MKRVAGAGGTLIAHLAIIVGLTHAARQPQLDAERTSFGAEVGGPEGSRMIAFLVDSPAEVPPQEPDGAPLQPIVLRSIALSPRAYAALDSLDDLVQPEPERPMQGDPSQAQEFARMRDMYAAQIHARVERTWERPERVPPGKTWDEGCNALVLQDRDGYVLEVEIAGCPRDAALEQSIVSAIYRASPLPAPAEPSVYSQRIRVPFPPR